MNLRQIIQVLAVVGAIGGGAASAQTQSAPPSTNSCPESQCYVNSSGHWVHRPEFSVAPPDGWTAQCADGSYSFSEHRRGTCSHHGGVARWRQQSGEPDGDIARNDRKLARGACRWHKR
jgi:hypothetical protein